MDAGHIAWDTPFLSPSPSFSFLLSLSLPRLPSPKPFLSPCRILRCVFVPFLCCPASVLWLPCFFALLPVLSSACRGWVSVCFLPHLPPSRRLFCLLVVCSLCLLSAFVAFLSFPRSLLWLAVLVPSHLVRWSLVTLFTVSTFWTKIDRVTSDQVCLESHACHTKLVCPLCGRLWPYSCPKYHFWRKSRRKAGFWVSKLHFWRKSRTKPSFLSFEPSFSKEVSQKSWVFEFRSFIFEGSLEQNLRFWVSNLHFWRKSRRTASFLSFEPSFLKEVSQNSFFLELRSSIFEGSLAEKLCFRVQNAYIETYVGFWRRYIYYIGSHTLYTMALWTAGSKSKWRITL